MQSTDRSTSRWARSRTSGWFGACLFLLISGFVITHVCLRAMAAEFALERELRIPDRRRAIEASPILTLAVASAAFGRVPAAAAFAAGVLASLALRTVSPRAV